MAFNAEHKSKVYGLAQTLILCIFGVSVLFRPGVPFWHAGTVTRVLSDALCAGGIVLLLVAISRIGQSIQMAPEPKKTATLITTGVYRYFRHPIYTAIIAVVVGLFLRKPTLPAVTAGTIVILFLLLKVQFEEKLLRARYPQYAEYMTTSWGILPWRRGAKT
jgi:protein-S-isoprenylcysteine O-methyltransferase Ste14